MSTFPESPSNSSPYFDCEGWWEQDLYGRQPMNPLHLGFDAGSIDGYGTDVIGPFTFDGALEEGGVVVMCKQYIEQHSVTYLGRYDGEGLMTGDWRIDHFEGPWMIRLRRLTSVTLDEIKLFAPHNPPTQP